MTKCALSLVAGLLLVNAAAVGMQAAERISPTPQADTEAQRNYLSKWSWLELLEGEVNDDADYYFFVRSGRVFPGDEFQLPTLLREMNKVYESMQKEHVELLFVGQGRRNTLEKCLRNAKVKFPVTHDDAGGAGAIPGYRSRPYRGITVVDANGNLVVELYTTDLLRRWREALQKWRELKAAKDDPEKQKAILKEYLPDQVEPNQVAFGDAAAEEEKDEVPADEQAKLDAEGSGLANFLRGQDEQQASLIKTNARYFIVVYCQLVLRGTFGLLPEFAYSTQKKPDEILRQQQGYLRKIAKQRLRKDVQLIFVTHDRLDRDELRKLIGDKFPIYNREEHRKVFSLGVVRAVLSHDANDLPTVALVRARDQHVLAEGCKPVVDDSELVLQAEETKQKEK